MVSQEELELLQMLRKKFQSAAKKYGSAIFNMEQLEQRIQMLIRNKGNIQAFLVKEVEFLKDATEKSEAKIKARDTNAQKKLTVNRIIEKNKNKIEQYPDSFFDPNASYEMRHLVGAISQFHQHFFLTAQHIFGGTHDGINLSSLFGDLERFYFIKEKSLQTTMLKQYISELSMSRTRTQKDIIDTRYLQTAGSYLYKINVGLERLFENTSEDMKRKTFSPVYEILEWQNESYEAFLKTAIDASKKILKNFRLIELVSYNARV